MTSSDPLDLDAIEARANAATPGPWKPTGHSHPTHGCRCLSCHQPVTVWQPGGLFCDDVGEAPAGSLSEDEGDRCDQFGYRWADATFVEHAREDMLALIAEVRRLRAQP